MKIKIINATKDNVATTLVNAFIKDIIKDHEIIEIKYRTASTNHTAWNCIAIIYKEKA